MTSRWFDVISILSICVLSALLLFSLLLQFSLVLVVVVGSCCYFVVSS